MTLRLAIAFLCFQFGIFAQSDSLEIADSIPERPVRKAMILSAVLPGAGQVYNYLDTPVGHKGRNNLFWKLPLMYAAIGSTGYFLIANQSRQHSLKVEYKDRLANVPASDLNPKWETYDAEGVLFLYNKYTTRRDLFILAFGASYLFQVVEAAVGAHFSHFDISEDLTLTVRPVVFQSFQPGLGLTVNFQQKNRYTPRKL